MCTRYWLSEPFHQQNNEVALIKLSREQHNIIPPRRLSWFALKLRKVKVSILSMTMNKILLVLIVSSGFLLIFYANNDIFTRRKWFQTDEDIEHHSSSNEEHPTTLARRQPDLYGSHHKHSHLHHKLHSHNITQPPAEVKRVRYVASNTSAEHNIFIIYTKENYMLKTKFELFMKSLLKYSSVRLHLHIISDEKSGPGAEEILRAQIQIYKSVVFYTLYSVEDIARQLSDITHVMMPHFSSSPGLISEFYADSSL